MEKPMKQSDPIPEKYLRYLGSYEAFLFDSWCGEPIAWGRRGSVTRIGEKLFDEIGAYGEWHFIQPHGPWVLVHRWLTPDEAREKYGRITAIGAAGRDDDGAVLVDLHAGARLAAAVEPIARGDTTSLGSGRA